MIRVPFSVLIFLSAQFGGTLVATVFYFCVVSQTARIVLLVCGPASLAFGVFLGLWGAWASRRVIPASEKREGC